MTCWQCSLATLYPDGALRCDLTDKVASEACLSKQQGIFQLFRSKKRKIETVRKSKPRRL